MPRRSSIVRKGYYRRSRSGRRTYVKPARITDRGSRGKGRKVIPKLKPGMMEQFGYNLHESAAQRHIAMRKSARSVGYAKTMQRVNALRVLLKREKDGPKALADVKWLQANAAALGSKTARRRSRRSRRSKRSRRRHN